jgi:hypothetical protein
VTCFDNIGLVELKWKKTLNDVYLYDENWYVLKLRSRTNISSEAELELICLLNFLLRRPVLGKIFWNLNVNKTFYEY